MNLYKCMCVSYLVFLCLHLYPIVHDSVNRGQPVSVVTPTPPHNQVRGRDKTVTVLCRPVMQMSFLPPEVDARTHQRAMPYNSCY